MWRMPNIKSKKNLHVFFHAFRLKKTKNKNLLTACYWAPQFLSCHHFLFNPLWMLRYIILVLNRTCSHFHIKKLFSFTGAVFNFFFCFVFARLWSFLIVLCCWADGLPWLQSGCEVMAHCHYGRELENSPAFRIQFLPAGLWRHRSLSWWGWGEEKKLSTTISASCSILQAHVQFRIRLCTHRNGSVAFVTPAVKKVFCLLLPTPPACTCGGDRWTGGT